MDKIKTINLYNLDETIAKSLLSRYEYPFEALNEIGEFIYKIINLLKYIKKINKLIFLLSSH